MNGLISVILLLLIGGFTGFLSGFLGVGGGFILVPLLIFLDVPTTTAIGSSLAYIMLTAASGVIQHYKQKSFDLKLASLISFGGVIAAQIGAFLTLYVEARHLEILLGLTLIGTAVRMVFQRYSNKENVNNKINYINYKIFTSIAIGLTAGFISGLLGVGGGFILVPLLILILHIPMHIAVGTSLMALEGSAISGTIRHWMIGHVDLYLTSILAISGIIAAPFGAKACKKVSQKQLQTIFSIMLFVFAFKLLSPI